MSQGWQFAIQDIKSLDELVSEDLTNWKVEEIFEIRQSDEDGRSSRPIGYFRDGKIAEAFADSKSHKSVHKVFALCRGKAAFLFGNREVLDMFDDEAEAAKLREAALAKLSAAERELLKL